MVTNEELIKAKSNWTRSLTGITHELPLGVARFSVEGQLELKAVPSTPNWSIRFIMPEKKRNNIKLYVRRVFIMDQREDPDAHRHLSHPSRHLVAPCLAVIAVPS
ncbi:hypothetical protein GY45DRAFT_1376218 [Cubamyces sp. BRFM 1775]|nr:hypothetical protein GY45DRAFT_1376218 [Cubamyces sp. BRFM 1775]